MNGKTKSYSMFFAQGHADTALNKSMIPSHIKTSPPTWNSLDEGGQAVFVLIEVVPSEHLGLTTFN